MSADSFVGGIPLVTVQSGNVTGDLWIDATPPDWQGQGASNLVKTFTLPEIAPGNITWARLYVSAYSGHMQEDKQPFIYILSQWDGDGVAGYEQVWNEPGHAAFQYVNNSLSPLGNDNTAFGGGLHDPFKTINLTENRVTSDYFVWYDVKNLIRNRTIFLNVKTAGCFDGRTKVATLVVAYNNASSRTLTRYWVNQGHDVCSYYTENNNYKVAVGSTTFPTRGIGAFTSATLTVDYMASHVGLFSFPTASYSGMDQGNYWSDTVCINDTYVDGIDPVSNYYLATVNFLNYKGQQCSTEKDCVCYNGNWTSPVFVGPDELTYTNELVGPPQLPTITFNHPLATGYDLQGPYSGFMHWDVTDILPTNTNAKLGYARDVTQTGLSAFFKIPLAFLVVKSPLAPAANFTANVTTGTAPLAVQFNDASTGGIPSAWAWDFGDGNISALRNPTHTYGLAGSYDVKLTVSNEGGSNASVKTGYITIVTPDALVPAVGFSADATTGPIPFTVQFTDRSTNTPSAWNWSFGDGNFSALRDPSHTYTYAGSFSVLLNASNSYGWNVTEKPGYITANSADSPPIAAFTASPVYGTAPLAVSFTDTSANAPTSWLWDFGDGDGTNATVQNPVHTYASAGTYPVTLTATNANGSDDEEKTGYITAVPEGSADSATILISPAVGTFAVGETYDYQIVLDSAPEGLAGFDMDVTLTNPGIAEITGVTYPSWAGLRNTTSLPAQSVSISAVDDSFNVQAGATDTVLANITLTGKADGMTPILLAIGNEMTADGGARITPSAINNGRAVVGSYTGPIADFTANPTSGSAPLTVQYTDTSTGNPTSWLWNFSDDGMLNSTNKNPSAIYKSAGSYSVSLTVSNDTGGSDTLVRKNYITVSLSSAPPPVAAFSGTPTSGTAPLTVIFTDSTTNDPTSRIWDFGDGNSSWSTDKTSFAHTYASANSYSVKLTASNAYGSDVETKNSYVTVTAASSGPVAAFTASTTSGTEPLTVKFTDKSTDGSGGKPWYWKWYFDDDATVDSSIQNPTHTFEDAGIYTVRLVVSVDEETWSDPATTTITVNTEGGEPGAAFTADPRSGAKPLSVEFEDSSSGDPTEWDWDFGDGDTSTDQNPEHEYEDEGTYDVSLTVTNSYGSDTMTRSDYISVTTTDNPPDLSISAIVPNLGSASGGTVFALEQNPVTINIANGGSGASAATTVKIVSSDGFSGTTTVPSIAAKSSTTVVVTDTKSRSTAGGSVTYTATVDPDKKVSESSETNNEQTSSFGIKYNGYKGMRYWSGKSDVTTKHTFNLKGGLIYSSGDSEYRSGSFGDGGWLDYTVTWDEDDLEIPSDATIRKAYLYVPYTWDNDNIAPDHVFIDFNGERVSRSAWYTDMANFGTYASYAYGLILYDVTSEFNKNAENSAVFTRENPNIADEAEAAVYTKLSMNEFYLVLIYEDSDKTEKQIFINEGYDLLGASKEYGTTSAEATAYVPFTGLTIDTDEMTDAMLITFVPFGDSYEGNLLYNGNAIATNVWDWGGDDIADKTGANGGKQVAIDERHVNSYLKSSGNTFAIQSTDIGGTPCMAAAMQILIVDLGGTLSSSSSSSSSSSDDDDDSSTKETVSSVSSTSGSQNAAGTQESSATSGGNSGAGTYTPPDTGNVRNLLSPTEPTAGDLLDNPPSGTGEGSSGTDVPPWFPPGALIGGFAVIGATGAYAYRSRWFPNGNGLLGQQVLCHDGSGTCPALTVNIGTGILSAVTAGTAGNRLASSSPDTTSGPAFRNRPAMLVIILLTAGLVLAAVLYGFVIFNPAGSDPADLQGGTAFDILPTVEGIQDLDKTNRVPDYPAGFSARNGLLFVYNGAGTYAIPDLEVRLSKGTNEVALTTATPLPSVNAVGMNAVSYLEEMGNGNGILEPGEWLMVYADNCYDSSAAEGEPKGSVLTWQPADSFQKVEVPVKDSVLYSLTDTGTGVVLQQGTLLFVPP